MTNWRKELKTVRNITGSSVLGEQIIEEINVLGKL